MTVSRSKIAGFSMIEALVSLAIFLLFFLGLATYMQLAIWSRGKIKREITAQALVLDKIEEFSMINPLQLTDNNDLTEEIKEDNHSYTRIIDITVNADKSRSVDVSVTGNATVFNVSTKAKTYLPLWGSK